MRFAAYLGYLAAVLTVAAYVPQVVRTWRTKKTDALSFGTFALVLTSSATWITYGAMQSDTPVILTNAGLAVLNCAILVAKVRYRDREPADD